MSEHKVEMTVNGARLAATTEARTSLGDFLRIEGGWTGVHLGCEHGVCGACTVIVAEKDGRGRAVRSCLMLAVQADGAAVTTAEGLAAPDGTLHPVQQALRENHGLQCGFCTPGILVAAKALLAQNANPTETEVRYWLAGNLCRCTGYDKIIRAVMDAAAEMRGAA